jgi:hypothetical protein
MPETPLSPAQKASFINRDARKYGTFAEIGAGQEVARWFFHVGGAAGTVAKTISAYDMAVSDAIYGPCGRYVSRQRLNAMLDYEYNLLRERLDPARGAKNTFFALANTVATRSFTRKEDGHGWMGIKFQTEPRAEPSEIIIHLRLLDQDNVRQQEALGIIGVNLIHGAFYHWQQPERLIRGLLDHLGWQRVEVDMIRFAGPGFANLDNRLMALQLVKQDLTEAALFTADGEAAQWSELLYKKPVLVQRGSFRPVTKATLDVFEKAREKFLAEPEVAGRKPVVLMEMTLRHLTRGDAIDHQDFLHRANTLGALGHTVLISNFLRFHRLASYLYRYTDGPLGLAIGASKLADIFDEKFYNNSEGGLLGGLGQLFRNQTRLYVYPSYNFSTGEVLTLQNFPLDPRLRQLVAFLQANGSLQDLEHYNPDYLRIRAKDVLDSIAAGTSGWEELVPPALVTLIKRDRLFGHA